MLKNINSYCKHEQIDGGCRTSAGKSSGTAASNFDLENVDQGQSITFTMVPFDGKYHNL